MPSRVTLALAIAALALFVPAVPAGAEECYEVLQYKHCLNR